jgi:plastocyanin
VAALVLASACTSSADLRPRETDNAAPLRQATLGTAVPIAAATQSDGPILVSLAENYFVPPLVTVKVGMTVIWHNYGQQSHDVRARDGSFTSPLLPGGGVFTYTFTKPGKYRYYCTLHGDMSGEVDVE